MKKGALEISFVWIFAIVVGIAIIFLAIYFSVKIIGIGEAQTGAQTGKEIGVLLNPLETGFESARSSSFSISIETRIYGSCDNEGNFGRQLIKVSQKSFKKWTETDLEVQFLNKYIFNEEFVEGEKFYVFSKPFEFPFKVGDLIYLTSSKDKYCFLDAPDEVERELKNLGQDNFEIENCSENSKKICFDSGTGCIAIVDYNNQIVQKESGRMYFEGNALMYGAIFSDKEIYECQIKRLMKRVEQTAKIYQDKISISSREGCDSNLDADLMTLAVISERIESSANLGLILKSLVESIDKKNKYASECKLW